MDNRIPEKPIAQARLQRTVAGYPLDFDLAFTAYGELVDPESYILDPWGQNCWRRAQYRTVSSLLLTQKLIFREKGLLAALRSISSQETEIMVPAVRALDVFRYEEIGEEIEKMKKDPEPIVSQAAWAVRRMQAKSPKVI